MSKTFKLVNPYVKGDFDNQFKASTSLSAAKKCWTELSQYFSNNIPKFAFTIQETQSGGLSHFVVNETKEDEEVDFKIKEVTMHKKNEKLLKEKLKNIEEEGMSGGKRCSHCKDNCDDDSDEIDHFYKSIKGFHNYGMPFYWFWYAPTPYRTSSCFIPSFTMPISPYIQIDTLTWYTQY